MPFNRITKTNSLSHYANFVCAGEQGGLGGRHVQAGGQGIERRGGVVGYEASIMQEVVIRIIVGQGVCICNTGWAEFWQPKVLTPRSRILEGFFTGKEVSLNLLYFLKWANPGLFLFIFVIFTLQFQCKLKKA